MARMDLELDDEVQLDFLVLYVRMFAPQQVLVKDISVAEFRAKQPAVSGLTEVFCSIYRPNHDKISRWLHARLGKIVGSVICAMLDSICPTAARQNVQR